MPPRPAPRRRRRRSHQTTAPINSDANSNAQAKLSGEPGERQTEPHQDYPLMPAAVGAAACRRSASASTRRGGSRTSCCRCVPAPRRWIGKRWRWCHAPSRCRRRRRRCCSRGRQGDDADRFQSGGAECPPLMPAGAASPSCASSNFVRIMNPLLFTRAVASRPRSGFL